MSRLVRLGRILVVPEVLTSIRHASTSTRLRGDREAVKNAVDLMYAAAYWRSGEHDPAVAKRGPPNRKLHSRTSIACGSTRLWSEGRVGVLGQISRRGNLGWHLDWVRALTRAAWGESSPHTLRLFIGSLLHLPNQMLVPKTLGQATEWHPTRGFKR